MATTFKTFLNNDVISSRTLLNEAIPLTGTIVSGTYGTNNIKNYAHGMFQSVYDYPYLSSSANHIFDITVGHASASAWYAHVPTIFQESKKKNIYNQMAQVLMGYDTDGDIRNFDEDGDLTGGTKMNECVFVNFSRLLTKDEIKKGSFAMEFGVDDAYATNGAQFVQRVKVSDVDAQNEFRINSPAGEYGILIADSTDGSDRLVNDAGTLSGGAKAGLIFYQAGVVVLTSSLFKAVDHDDPGSVNGGLLLGATNDTLMATGKVMDELMISSSIETVCDAVRNRIYNLSFNNTTELNSTIYFCRVNNNDFNYSSNPTYLSGSKIVVKETSSDEPVSYITTIGMYSADNELLAVAKLSEPLKKTPSNEFTLRVRLDY